VLPLKMRADFLKVAMLEDRKEIRILKGRIYQGCSALTVSSFAITAFFARHQGAVPDRSLLIVIDVSFLLILWVFFGRLKIDVSNGRKCLEAREDMIRELGTKQPDPAFDPFPKVDLDGKSKINDNDLYWIVVFCTVALVVKMLVVSFGIEL
jgi:hypothetical protein